MRIDDLSGKRVCILGYGREGQAMHEAISTHARDVDLTIADRDERLQIARPNGLAGRARPNGLAGRARPIRPPAGQADCRVQTGEDYLDHLDRFDVIIKSPGIPPKELVICNLQSALCNLTGSTQIFLDTVADRGATVIGVTGSKGKSTTATLIHRILAAAGKDAHLVGNIGEPAVRHIDRAKPGTIFVLEMSSYQLMDCTASPHVAVITSFFPEHLDYHGSLDAYRDAKANICRHQTENDVVVFDATSEGAERIARMSAGRRIAAHAEDLPRDAGAMRIIGEHNRRNAACAFLAASLWKVPTQTAIDAMRTFEGLPHRLQSIGVIDGIEWIDDSISTTPESAVAALDALGDRVAVMILGGRDRGYDFAPLADRLARSPVRSVVLMGESAPRIREALRRSNAGISFIDAPDMPAAVEHAKAAITQRSANSYQRRANCPIVLLSPASPSHDMFRDFEERGDAFARCIRAE